MDDLNVLREQARRLVRRVYGRDATVEWDAGALVIRAGSAAGERVHRGYRRTEERMWAWLAEELREVLQCRYDDGRSHPDCPGDPVEGAAWKCKLVAVDCAVVHDAVAARLAAVEEFEWSYRAWLRAEAAHDAAADAVLATVLDRDGQRVAEDLRDLVVPTESAR